MERFSQLMGDDEDEEEQVHSNDDKAIVDDSDEKQESALESEVQSLVSEEVEQESPSLLLHMKLPRKSTILLKSKDRARERNSSFRPR